MDNELLIKAENVSKKFALDFKKSLIYGLKDVLHAGLSSKSTHHNRLRDKEFWAVNNVSFEVRRGECLGLIGHNGAGKSTLLKMLNGLINPDKGKIIMRGRVGALIELGAGFNPILTGRENVYNNGAVLGFSKKEIDTKFDSIVEFSEIGEFIDSPVQNYSSGMKVRLGFAIASQMDPDILLIDEVLAVGDIGFRLKCINAIGKLLKNSAVIFVSHTMTQIYRVSSSILLMNKGKCALKTNNLGLGIENYYKLFNNDKEEIHGTGEVKVLDLNVTKDNTETIKFGSLLNLNLHLQVSAHLEHVSIQLVFWNQELIPVLHVIDQTGQPFLLKNNIEGEHIINIKIPQINLNPGAYNISVNVNSPDLMTAYCRHDNAARFTVSGEFVSGSNTISAAQWK